VIVIGSGSHFLSGISYYTHRLAVELSQRHPTSVVLMRRLLPRRLYPGAERVGRRLADFEYPTGVRVFDGVDWHSPASLLRACAFIRRSGPDIAIVQWWTGTVLHAYLVMAVAVRASGGRLVVEFHESLDTGEERLPLARAYVRLGLPLLVRMSSGLIVHSRFDRERVAASLPAGRRPIHIVTHGPYDRYGGETGPVPRAQDGVCRFLWFGVLRPFKGVDVLVEAFSALPEEIARTMRLRIVGEVWEGFHKPLDLVAASPHRARISLRSEYIPDADVGDEFAAADVVVLPYLRSSASGPLHIAMARGLPVVVSDVGGLREAASGYDGALFVAPGDSSALGAAMVEATRLAGRRFDVPNSWRQVADTYDDLFRELDRKTRTHERRTI